MSRLRFHCQACHAIDLRVPTRADEEIDCTCGGVARAEFVEMPEESAAEVPLALPVEPAPPVVAYERPLVVDGEMIDPHFPDPVGDLYVPLALIAAASVLGYFGCVLLHLPPRQLHRLFFPVLAIKTVAFGLGYLLMTHFTDVGFGTPRSALLKLMVVGMVPDVLVIWTFVLIGSCAGSLLAMPIGIGSAILLLMKLFDMEYAEAKGFVFLVGPLLFLATIFSGRMII